MIGSRLYEKKGKGCEGGPVWGWGSFLAECDLDGCALAVVVGDC